MILASVIPYHHPRGPGHGRSPACIVRITDGARVLAEESIPVGRLACRDHGAYPCAACEAKPKARGPAGLHFERVVGPAELAEVVERVVALVRGHGAGGLRVEEPTGAGVEADRGRAIAAALRVALAGMEDEGPGTEAPSPIAAPQSQASAPAEPTPALTPAQAPKRARRVAGIDPGARHVAATVVEETRRGGNEPQSSPDLIRVPGPPGSTARDEQSPTGETPAQARYVAHFTHTLGRDVPLARTKVITPKDGRAPYTKTTRHEVTDEDVRGLIRELSGFLARHEVDEAAIETAAFAFDGAGAMLLRSNRIGGVIEGALIAAGLPVVSTSSKTWRAEARKMAGPTRGLTLAQGWKPAVLALIANMPTDLAADDREHILDAGGCALLAFAPPPEVRPAPARTRAPRGQGKPRGNEGRKARQERERAALGCLGEVCRARGQRGHADECPIKVAQRAKVSERMKGNSNATKGARA